MLAITREINFAETAFVVGGVSDAASGGDDGGASEGAVEASVRIFTPEYEVPFAGHPTLGLAHVAAQRGQQQQHLQGRLSLAMSFLRACLAAVGRHRSRRGKRTVFGGCSSHSRCFCPFACGGARAATAARHRRARRRRRRGRSAPMEACRTSARGCPTCWYPCRTRRHWKPWAWGRAAQGALLLRELQLDSDTHPLSLTVSVYFYYARRYTHDGSGRWRCGGHLVAHVLLRARRVGRGRGHGQCGRMHGRLLALRARRAASAAGVGASAGTGCLRISQGAAMGRPSSLLIDARAPGGEGCRGGRRVVIRVGGRVEPIASGLWAN